MSVTIKELPPEPDDAARSRVFFAADLVLLAYGPAFVLHVLLVQRDWDPFEGRWALPGGHVEPCESSQTAAARETAEETGIKVPSASLVQVGVFDAPGRDPRGRYVTVAYTALLQGMPAPTAGDDARAARWVPVRDLLDDPDALAFDHHRIVLSALDSLDALDNA
jgi:8-oxo-dGTP diphosphatase